jgi:ribosomal protein S18 acetylase RimI-like enzyme
MVEATSSYWLVAEENLAIAYLSAEFRERNETWCMQSHRICYLASIVVAPHCRRKGVARALLDKLKREALARGVTHIELDVWAFNKDAKAAFRQLGFLPLMERMSIPAELEHRHQPHRKTMPRPGAIKPRK